jgi:hypothetical protein
MHPSFPNKFDNLPLTPASSRTSPAPSPSSTLAPWLTADKVQLLHASTHFPWGLSHTGRSSRTTPHLRPFQTPGQFLLTGAPKQKTDLVLRAEKPSKKAKTRWPCLKGKSPAIRYPVTGAGSAGLILGPGN